MKIYRICAFVFLAAQFSYAGETVFVNSLKAKLYSEAKASSIVVSEIDRGDSLSVMVTEGNWIKVTAKGKIGWIAKLFTAKVAPLKSDDLKKFNNIDKEKVGRVRLNYENKGAARGLTESTSKVSRYGFESNQKSFEAIQFIDAQQTDLEAIKKFQAEGQLKP